MNKTVTVKNLRKAFGPTQVLDNISLEVSSGEIVAIVGPNGSGKSTFLNVVAGLLQADEGTSNVNLLSRDQFSYIFQNYRESLFPWFTNRKNVGFPLAIRDLPQEIISAKIEELQSAYKLAFSFDSYPYELSGGQQQILTFLRAIITEPHLLLIDEPFSALDYENNLRLRQMLFDYYLRYEPTILIVTHNLEEAVHLANKIIVFSKRPAVITDVIHNPIPYPRTVETITTDEFDEVSDKILTAFHRNIAL